MNLMHIKRRDHLIAIVVVIIAKVGILGNQKRIDNYRIIWQCLSGLGYIGFDGEENFSWQDSNWLISFCSIGGQQ